MNAMVKESTLTNLANDINTEHDAATRKATEAIEHARRCGELLIDAKQWQAFSDWLALTNPAGVSYCLHGFSDFTRLITFAFLQRRRGRK